MTGLLRAELLKIRTTRMVWGLLALGLALTIINVGSLIVASLADESGFGSVRDPDTVRLFYGIAAWPSGAIMVAMISGIVAMTSEYRYQTISQAFLVTPRRGQVVAAKLAAQTAIGAICGVAAMVSGAVVVIPTVAINDGPASPLSHGVPGILGGAVLAFALYALVGVGLGALINNQVAAIVVAVGWAQLIDGGVGAFVPELQRWLPGGAVRAVTGVDALGELRFDTLPAWGGTLLLLAYGLAFAGTAVLTTLKRDIT